MAPGILLGMKSRGFTIIEILVVVAVIGLLASVILVTLSGTRGKARDARRKAELSQMGRFLTGSGCFVPDSGAGTYDIAALIPEVVAKYPQAAQFINQIPRDPRVGDDDETYYRYIYGADGRCALYGNLENADEPVTLPSLTAPTAGGGTGILEAGSAGWNGSTKYYQISG